MENASNFAFVVRSVIAHLSGTAMAAFLAPMSATAVMHFGDSAPTQDSQIAQRNLNVSKAIRLLLGILTLLTIAIAVIGFFEVRSPRTIVFGSDWVLIALCLLLATEIALTATLYIQMRQTRSAEGRLRESEERMIVASEAADIGLWRWDLRTQNFWLTPLAKSMLELPPGMEFDADLIESRIHPEDRPAVQLAIDTARSDEFDVSRTYEIEYRIQTNDLRTRWLRMRGRPRRDRFGQPREMTGTMIDITDSKQMQGELEKQRLTLLHLSRISVLGELSGALAHELKQPLTAIMSNAQAAQRILSHQSIDFEELRGAIGDIIEDDARAGSVISRLRALLKNEEVRREPVDLHTLLLTSLDLVQSHLTARKINVIKRFWGADLIVSGDPVQLQQLMLNIFLNASEAMGTDSALGGTVLVTTDKSSERHIHIAVSDSGCGIRHEVLTKLFDPLVTTKPQGMGLGLSISRAIVESHGGKIWAMNNAGRGATLHVMFPLLRPN